MEDTEAEQVEEEEEQLLLFSFGESLNSLFFCI